jgi:hypothetical protein
MPCFLRILTRYRIILCLFRASLCDLIIASRDNHLPARVIDKPRILIRYCEASRSFTKSPEARLIRAVGGLLHLSTILPVPLSFIQRDKRILTAWMDELIDELNRVIDVYRDQAWLSKIADKMLTFMETIIAANVASFTRNLRDG